MKTVCRFLVWVFFSRVREQSVPEREPRWWTQMIAAGLGVIVVLLLVSMFQYNFVQTKIPSNGNNDITRFGIAGDFFGFANALFSALAFSTIIVTLWMQKHELRQQRLELDQTQQIMNLQIKEMELQRQEMQDQNESFRIQRFESTFFNMLALHNQVIAEVTSNDGKKRGREAFTRLVEELDPRFAGLGQEYNTKVSKRTVDEIVHAYETWYEENEHHVGHYFRTLYNLFLYVEEHGPTDKTTYARLARAQLSRGELDLLLVNGLSQNGREKFKPLIVQFDLLKHVRKTPENQALRDAYLPTVDDSFS